jgi:hypothetical protein
MVVRPEVNVVQKGQSPTMILKKILSSPKALRWRWLIADTNSTINIQIHLLLGCNSDNNKREKDMNAFVLGGDKVNIEI